MNKNLLIVTMLLMANITLVKAQSFPMDTSSTSIKCNVGPIYTVVEESPSFPGGEKARIKYLTENLKYPSEAIDSNLQGTVYLSFVVEMDGSISQVKVVRGVGGGCNQEAERVVKAMPNWEPGKSNGFSVRCQYMMPIKFVLMGDENPKKAKETAPKKSNSKTANQPKSVNAQPVE
jgi:protein TonB